MRWIWGSRVGASPFLDNLMAKLSEIITGTASPSTRTSTRIITTMDTTTWDIQFNTSKACATAFLSIFSQTICLFRSLQKLSKLSSHGLWHPKCWQRFNPSASSRNTLRTPIEITRWVESRNKSNSCMKRCLRNLKKIIRPRHSLPAGEFTMRRTQPTNKKNLKKNFSKWKSNNRTFPFCTYAEKENSPPSAFRSPASKENFCRNYNLIRK